MANLVANLVANLTQIIGFLKERRILKNLLCRSYFGKSKEIYFTSLARVLRNIWTSLPLEAWQTLPLAPQGQGVKR